MNPREKTVLIVDDDEAMLNLLEILVHRDGFNVLRADSVDAAVFKLRRNPDVVLLDLIFPGTETGLDVLELIRGSEGPKPFVIVITAHESEHPVVEAARKDPNVSYFLSKPIKQDQLLELMHRMLRTWPPEGAIRGHDEDAPEEAVAQTQSGRNPG
ncbi:MAG: response regulator [Elusimicrobiota bacterium]